VAGALSIAFPRGQRSGTKIDELIYRCGGSDGITFRRTVFPFIARFSRAITCRGWPELYATHMTDANNGRILEKTLAAAKMTAKKPPTIFRRQAA